MYFSCKLYLTADINEFCLFKIEYFTKSYPLSGVAIGVAKTFFRNLVLKYLFHGFKSNADLRRGHLLEKLSLFFLLPE